MNVDGKAAIPLWLLYEEDVGPWCAGQAAAANRWIAEQGFTGERQRVVLVPDEQGRLAAAVCGLGRRQGALTLWQAAAIAANLPPRRFRTAQALTGAEASQLCLGFAHAGYRFNRYRRNQPESAASLEPPSNADLDYVAIAAESMAMARDWINTPAADFGPAELAAAVRRVAELHGAAFREWVGDELLAGNFPAIHAVGRASSAAPRLAEIRWTPKQAAAPQVVLVGKGVCFDSGGLDIKTGAGMALMKKDMGGAAVALALAHMLMTAGLRANLRLLIPAVENSISGNAYRPGDVLSTRKGLTRRGGQHRRGGAAGAVRRARRGRCGAAGLDHRLCHAHGRGARGAGPRIAGAVRHRPADRRRPRSLQRRGARRAVAHAAVVSLCG